MEEACLGSMDVIPTLLLRSEAACFLGGQAQVRRTILRMNLILMPRNADLSFPSRQFSSTHQGSESDKQEDPGGGGGSSLRKSFETLCTVPHKNPF